MVNVNTVKTWLREGKSAEECRLYAKSEIVSQAVQEFERDSKSNTAVAVMEPPAPTEFETRAIPLIERNVPVIPLKPRTKIAFLNSWESKATTDRAQIEQWAKEYPDANVASVAKAQPGGVWFFDADRAGLVDRIENETGHKIPTTLMVRSRPGAGHYYFRQNAASIAMGNRQASDAQGELWSARVDDRYVVGPASVHPETGLQYEIINSAPIVEAPQWLIDYCIQNDKKNEKVKTGHAELDNEDPIAQGGRNNSLTSILGKARQVLKMDREQLYVYGLSVNEKRCRPPLPDSEVKTIADSVGGYAVKESGAIVFPEPQQATSGIELPNIQVPPYPVFPSWVFGGIPAYDKWVKPFCKLNSRYSEYMMLPLMALIMNYMSTKGVRIEYKTFPLSIFLLLVGRKGRVIKSSSAQDAMELCEKMGILKQHGSGTTNAEGKTLVFTVGSTEGLGLEMSRTNCKNAVLFYDEFSKLIAKMSIENSSFANDLSTTYESGKFSNGTKSRKENFAFDPGQYCLSLIGCTTDKRYAKLASRLFSSVDGMDERFFVLYQPEVLKDVEPMVSVPLPIDVANETKKLVDQAVDRGVFSIEDSEPLREISRLNNRLEIRAEKWALAFAVLLGKPSIDETCIERGIALSKYEWAVKKYLAVGEAISREGGLQREIRLHIERAGGSMKLRDLQRKVNYDDYGVSLWRQVYGGLITSRILDETGTGKHGSPVIVRVLQPMLKDDEE